MSRSTEQVPPLPGAARKPGPAVLWLGVAVVFAALAAAYFFAFRAAHTAQIKDVPLGTAGGRP